MLQIVPPTCMFANQDFREFITSQLCMFLPINMLIMYQANINIKGKSRKVE